jgi:hypothetical protein
VLLLNAELWAVIPMVAEIVMIIAWILGASIIEIASWKLIFSKKETSRSVNETVDWPLFKTMLIIIISVLGIFIFTFGFIMGSEPSGYEHQPLSDAFLIWLFSLIAGISPAGIIAIFKELFLLLKKLIEKIGK